MRYIPKLDSSTDKAHDFMCDLESWDNKIICIDDIYYKVEGVEDFIREYGQDSWSQVRKLDMEDMVCGGRCGVLHVVSVDEAIKYATNIKLKISIEFELNQIEDEGEISDIEIQDKLKSYLLEASRKFEDGDSCLYVDTTDGEEVFNVYLIS